MPGVTSGDRGNWHQQSLRDRGHACFAKKANEFYRLKALITLEQVSTTEWSKKNKNPN